VQAFRYTRRNGICATMLNMSPDRLWYLNPALRQKVKGLIQEQEGSFRGVAQRIGVSHVSLNRLVNGVTNGSTYLPALMKFLGLDLAEHIAVGEHLSDAQVVWLKLLADIERAGLDPTEVEAGIRKLAKLPPNEP
jgi:hypothetical protein